MAIGRGSSAGRAVTTAIALVPVALAMLAVGAGHAAAPTVAVEDIPPTPQDMLSARPGADGLIRNGDESTVERVFVYLDGCPLMELVRPVAGTGRPEMVMLADGDTACVPERGAATGIAPGLDDGTAALAEDTGLHVRLFREDGSVAPRTDVERLTSPEGQSLIVDITSVDPRAIAIMARGGRPAGPAGDGAFAIPPLPGEPGGAAGTGTGTAGGTGGGVALAAGPGFGGSGYGGNGGGRGAGAGPEPIRVSALEPPRSGGKTRPRRDSLTGSGGALAGIPSVPLPAGLGLLALALGVLGLVARRVRRPRTALRALRGGVAVSV